MSHLDDEIAELERILNAGANSVTVGDTRVGYDLDQVRRRLTELQQIRRSATRPIARSIKLSSGFAGD